MITSFVDTLGAMLSPKRDQFVSDIASAPCRKAQILAKVGSYGNLPVSVLKVYRPSPKLAVSIRCSRDTVSMMNMSHAIGVFS